MVYMMFPINSILNMPLYLDIKLQIDLSWTQLTHLASLVYPIGKSSTFIGNIGKSSINGPDHRYAAEYPVFNHAPPVYIPLFRM